MYECAFESLFSNFLKELQNDTNFHSFLEYFKRYYTNRTEVWAYFFRKGVKANTNNMFK